jgi:hypothetical protein
MWKCLNCCCPSNDEAATECKLCKAYRGFDPEAETKILPAVKIVEDQPRVGRESDR